MIDPLAYLVRLISAKRHKSRIPTGILPLSKIKRAAVFIDYLDAEADQTAKDAAHFFGSRNIAVKVYNAKKWDIDLFGRYRMKKKDKQWNEDLFISTTVFDNYASEHMAICSPAKFKVGRQQVKNDIFDLVVSDPADKLIRQPEAFKAISDLLLKVE